MKGPSPAFSFYPKDWLSDGPVRELTHEQRGIYVELLSIYWIEGGLPAEVDRLSRLAGVPLRRFMRLWPAISRCFTATAENGLRQKRLEEEKSKQIAFREAQRARGLKGGKPRIINADAKPGQTRGLAGANPGQTLPSPSPSPSPNGRNERTPVALPAEIVGDRTAREREVLALVREIAEIEDRDPAEVIADGKRVDGDKRTGSLNPAAWTDARLMATLLDLRSNLADAKRRRPRGQVAR